MLEENKQRNDEMGILILLKMVRLTPRSLYFFAMYAIHSREHLFGLKVM